MSARKSPRPLHAGKRWGINAKWTGEQAIHNSQWSRRCARRARLWLSHLSVQHGCSASSHRSALRLRGVPWLRTALCSVCSPLQPFGPPMFASSLAAFLALLGSSYRPALRWPGIPGRRSRLRGWHRVTLRNQPCLKEKRQGWFCFSFILPPWRTSRYR